MTIFCHVCPHTRFKDFCRSPCRSSTNSDVRWNTREQGSLRPARDTQSKSFSHSHYLLLFGIPHWRRCCCCYCRNLLQPTVDRFLGEHGKYNWSTLSKAINTSNIATATGRKRQVLANFINDVLTNKGWWVRMPKLNTSDKKSAIHPTRYFSC
jgi:hypothetical protein